MKRPTITFVLLFLAILVICQAPSLAVKRVIVMIGDGMGFKHVEITRNYLGYPLTMETLPVKYGCATFEYGGGYDPGQAWSNFNYVASGATDSASAATALDTGVKVNYGNINTNNGDVERLLSMPEYVRLIGKSAGVVSTVPVSHATPAGFAAHNNDRGNYSAIAREMITSYGDGAGARGNTPTLQCVIGGGHPTWDGTFVGATEYNQLVAGTTGQGWTFNQRVAGANGNTSLTNAAATATKLFALYGGLGGNMPYRLANGSGYNSECPTLAVMSNAALTVLNKDNDGFFLMIEGGAIDWASHANAINETIGEVIDFDNAVAAVTAWVDANDPTWADTLLIVTADHETGYITRGAGQFPNVALANPGAGVLPTPGVHFAWNSAGHTNSLVPLYAKGAGSSMLTVYTTLHDPGYNINYLDNTRVCEVMRKACADSYRFTVASDMHNNDAIFDSTLVQMQTKVGGIGAFLVSPGDLDPPANLRTRINTRCGTGAVWFPVVGNHDAESPTNMTWRRSEYTNGNSVRLPLKTYTNMDGPTGTVETNFSWDYGDVHYIMLNTHWNGGTTAGSDSAQYGDVVAQLRAWLNANLASTTKPAIIVFGHEPAYPQNNNIGASLDRYPVNRTAFWDILEADLRVKAYVNGHTHYYSRYQRPGGRVWQIDVGSAATDLGDDLTFLNVIVTGGQLQFDAWRDLGTGVFSLADTWSVPIAGDPPQAVSSPSAAKRLGDGAYVTFPAISSAVFDGFLYVQDSTPCCGIRVDRAGHTVPAGKSVTVSGLMKTSGDGERYVQAYDIAIGADAEAKAVVMPNHSISGDAWEYNPATKAGQEGIHGANDINTVGLLVHVYGAVTYKGVGYFYMDDGSGCDDGSGHLGVKVMTYGAVVPDVGDNVNFRGIASCYKSGGNLHRLARHVSGLAGPPSFVAYNDCVWQSGQSIGANVTTFGIGSGYSGPTSGHLINRYNGADTGVTVTLIQSGGVTWQPNVSGGGADTAVGTPAYNIFGGIVNLLGVIYYGSAGWWVDAEFTGLDPNGAYEFVTSANRNNGGYANRISKYTISGADSFVNISSPGVTIGDGGASTTFSTGWNYVNGYIANWAGIRPGSDGAFKVRAEVGAGGDPVLAYAFSAFRLSRTPFTAFNDCVWEATQSIGANVTTFGIGGGYSGPTSGHIVDRGTGADTGVTLTLTESGGVQWQPSVATGGADTNAGTDAYSVFGGAANLRGVTYYGAVGWWVDATFTGLDPYGIYEFVTSANRADATYANRFSKYTISGADSFVNQSSSGVTIGDSGASSTFCTGYNTANGYIARWTGINPGPDGTFKVRAEVGAGGDAQKGYAFSAIKLSQAQ